MKIGIKKNRNSFGHKGGDNTYIHLLIENSDDVMFYNKVLASKNAKNNTDLWFGFKSQDFRKSISNYMVHERPFNSAETILLATKLEYKESGTSLVEFCQMSDNIVSNKCVNILEDINKGHIVRINNRGGFCYLLEGEYDDYDDVYEPSVEEVNNFIYFGRVEKVKYNITNRSVIIENDYIVSKKFKKILGKYIPNGIDELKNFKNIIRTYSKDEIIKLFVEGIENGLRNICFETSGQDLRQIKKMSELLNIVEDITNVKMNLYILSHSENVLEFFEDFNVKKLG